MKFCDLAFNSSKGFLYTVLYNTTQPFTCPFALVVEWGNGHFCFLGGSREKTEHWDWSYSLLLKYSDNVNVAAKHQEPAKVLSQLGNINRWRVKILLL